MIDPVEIPAHHFDQGAALGLTAFRKMDYSAVTDYDFPIALMMEQAGYHLARLCFPYVERGGKVLVAAGQGNNGGGGLVAARRLAAWGYDVSVELHGNELRPLPKRQLERALKFGARMNTNEPPVVILDAIFGFSQRLPLSESIEAALAHYNAMGAVRISLDIPTGWPPPKTGRFFCADVVLCLAAPKKILIPLDDHVRVMIADIGLPLQVYRSSGFRDPLPFGASGIFEWKR